MLPSVIWAGFIWLITGLFYNFQFFLRGSMNAISDRFMIDFHIGAEKIGQLSAAYYITYAVCQIPVGIALDVWGPKKVLRVGTVLCLGGAIVFGLSHTFQSACLGRCLIGMGAAVSFIGSIRMNTLWISSAHLAFAIGLLSSMGKLGGAAANSLWQNLIVLMPSWHEVVLSLCLWGGFLTVLIWLFAKNGPHDSFRSVVDRISFQNIKKQLLTVLRSPTVWCMGFYGYAMYLTLSVLSETYSIGFLCERLAVSRPMAGKLSALLPIGSACGAPLISYLSDYVKKRRIFLIISASLTTFFASVIFFGPPLSLGLASLCLFCLGFFSGGQILIFVISAESLPHYLTGMATGLTNALLMLGGALHNPLIGWLLECSWDGRTHNGHPVYKLADYRLAFCSIFACFLVALLVSLFVSESHPYRRKSAH